MNSIIDVFSLFAYDYELPEEFIAQNPVSPRDSSRLMVLDPARKTVEHRIFRDIISYLGPDDLLVLNDTRVIPARIRTVFSGGDAEILLLRPRSGDCETIPPYPPFNKGGFNIWEALVKPGKKLRNGMSLKIASGGDAPGEIEILEEIDDGVRLVRVLPGGEKEGKNIYEWLDEVGEMPLPPYIKKSDKSNKNSYQTIFAEKLGSAAAPTASLHFTQELLDKIKNRGVKIVRVTLHVGLGTFRPVRTADIRQHVMHHESCTILKETADIIARHKEQGGRVVAAGTTVIRTLESFGPGKSGSMETNLFITPGFRFSVADALITNFHTPKSSLLMLVSAFAGEREFLMNAYEEAIRERYRFFSFGDAMFIQKPPSCRGG